MATIIIGSARKDERGKLSGGTAGDSLQKSTTNDTQGEVSMQNMYNHTKGWYILRPKKIEHANKMASIMRKACNNKNIGYDQANRLGVIKYGIDTKVKTECDCSTLVREVIKESTGVDVGNFTTYNEKDVLGKSGLFEAPVSYVSQTKTPVFDGDVLVTKTKGHTVICVGGNPRENGYTEKEFILDVQKATGSEPDGVAGKETIGNTVTISATKNRTHNVVSPVQKRLYAIGFKEVGEADGIAGAKFTKAVNRYQKEILGYKNTDGEITAGGKMWKSLLGMI